MADPLEALLVDNGEELQEQYEEKIREEKRQDRQRYQARRYHDALVRIEGATHADVQRLREIANDALNYFRKTVRSLPLREEKRYTQEEWQEMQQ